MEKRWRWEILVDAEAMAIIRRSTDAIDANFQ